ncbi:hypothetical protein FB451DRAFT_1395556 [Mycena latifolia]|nr:hypothetical protein FB451DRAFT_1395556 [Mycena latifolia]
MATLRADRALRTQARTGEAPACDFAGGRWTRCLEHEPLLARPHMRCPIPERDMAPLQAVPRRRHAIALGGMRRAVDSVAYRRHTAGARRCRQRGIGVQRGKLIPPVRCRVQPSILPSQLLLSGTRALAAWLQGLVNTVAAAQRHRRSRETLLVDVYIMGDRDIAPPMLPAVPARVAKPMTMKGRAGDVAYEVEDSDMTGPGVS